MNWRICIAAFVCAGVLVGCGAEKGSSDQKMTGADPGVEKLKIGVVFDSGGRGDKSFNDSAWAGIERAKAELGIGEKSIESKSVSDYEPNLTAMADQGCDLIVGVGLGMEQALAKVAKAYPNQKFAIVDGTVDAPNVRMLKFKEEEGSFLAGYLAALMSKTGKIGFVGGMQIPLIVKFYSGYAAGAKTANPSIEILPEKYTGSWDNVDVGKQSANVLFSGGADVVYHAAGRAGIGVIGAAQERKLFAIGVDSDQDYLAEGYVLASMVKRVDESVFSTIKDLSEGKFSGGERIYALADGGVGLSEMKFTKEKIGAENLAMLEAVKAKITSGELKVPTNKQELETYLASQRKQV